MSADGGRRFVGLFFSETALNKHSKAGGRQDFCVVYFPQRQKETTWGSELAIALLGHPARKTDPWPGLTRPCSDASV